jgi:hypothetical protein
MTYSLSLRPRALAGVKGRDQYALVGHRESFLNELDAVFVIQAMPLRFPIAFGNIDPVRLSSCASC